MATTIRCLKDRCQHNTGGFCQAPAIRLAQHHNCFNWDLSDTGLLLDCDNFELPDAETPETWENRPLAQPRQPAANPQPAPQPPTEPQTPSTQ